MKVSVIRSHVTKVGYEDSNPFSLCEWVLKVGREGHTEIVEGEFDRWFLTPQTKELIGEGKDAYTDFEGIHFVSEYKEVYTEEWLCAEYSLEEGIEELIVVAPIGELVSLGDGDIEVTSVV